MLSRLRALLADGSARPADELARGARAPVIVVRTLLQAQVAAGRLQALREGAHTYYALAGRGAARAAMPVAPLVVPPGSTPALRLARTCYHHLAGAFGVALYAAMREHGWLQGTAPTWRLTPAGVAALGACGLPVKPAMTGRDCRDWTLRQPHLGGPLGVAITTAMLDAGWFWRAAHGRALLPCAAGVAAFARWGVDAATLQGVAVTATRLAANG